MKCNKIQYSVLSPWEWSIFLLDVMFFHLEEVGKGPQTAVSCQNPFEALFLIQYAAASDESLHPDSRVHHEIPLTVSMVESS